MRGFLEAIQGDLAGRLIEIRAIEGGHVEQFFHGSPEPAVERALELSKRGRDAYYGVLPRLRESGKGEDIHDWTPTLWADLDGKHYASQVGAFQALATVNPAPQIVVDSGHGYHAYWLLDQDYPFDQAQLAMKGIALETGADRVYDKARVLRVPGTTNWKDEWAPVPVRLLKFDLTGRRFRLSDFADYSLAAMDSERPARPKIKEGSIVTAPSSMPMWLTELVGTDPGKGHRSEHCFRVACAMIEVGYDDETIERVFASNPDGVGAKYEEKGEGASRWLGYTLTSARKKVGR